ncbi:MAG: transcription elongation factor GreA [Parcubacteria group bacterium Gr01-1014_107]|nr:MAG: transcription elongation factor GreA [Parcubacteria group bacterium Gr01-1014_107]
MQENKEYLTKEKFDELSLELDHLRKVKRKEVAERLEYARSLGDLAENAEYHEARGEQANIEDRIAKLEAIFKSAEIISSHHGGEVSVGSVVVVQKENEKESWTYTIVGSEEADIRAGKISISSPFGQSILGKKKGQAFSFNTPSGLVKYKVVSIK